MKSIKTLLTICLASIACTLYAQGDWQTSGGGYGSRNHYGNGYSSNYRSSYGSNYGHHSVNLLSGGYDKNNVSLLVGYVNKQWTSEYEVGGKRSENLFGEKGKRLHGLQVGVGWTPSFNFGLGMQTGLFYEAYFSTSQYVKNQEWDRFTEHDLYIPAHLTLRIPFTHNCGLTLFGGAGFQWAIYGRYRDWGHEYYDYDGNSHYIGPEAAQQYGNGWPKHVNWQAEGGFNLRLNLFTFAFTYSYGLTNHHLENTELGEYAIKSRQDKMAFSIGLAF